MVPFIPSHQHVVANLDTSFFDQKMKRIVRRTEKRLKVGDQPIEFMVMENTVMHGTNEDPQLLAMASIAAAQANTYNVGKLVEDTKYYKEKMK